MFATLPNVRRSPRASARRVRSLLLELTYRMHTTVVVKRERANPQPRSNQICATTR
jgi:hypothetical protein